MSKYSIFIFVLLISTSCIKDIESSNTNISKETKQQKVNISETEKIIEKIHQTYSNLDNYQDEVIFRRTFKNPGHPIMEEEGTFETYYEKDKNFKFQGSITQTTQDVYVEVLQLKNTQKFRLQRISQTNKVKRPAIKTFKYKQAFDKKKAISLVNSYSFALRLLFRDGKNFKTYFYQDENRDFERLADQKLNGEKCYVFSSGKMIEQDIKPKQIDIKSFENDTTFSKEILEMAKKFTIHKEDFIDKGIKAGSGVKIVYWFRQKDYMLLKTETITITPDMEAYEIVNYQPTVNKKIDKNKFIWSEKDKNKTLLQNILDK